MEKYTGKFILRVVRYTVFPSPRDCYQVTKDLPNHSVLFETSLVFYVPFGTIIMCKIFIQKKVYEVEKNSRGFLSVFTVPSSTRIKFGVNLTRFLVSEPWYIVG